MTTIYDSQTDDSDISDDDNSEEYKEIRERLEELYKEDKASTLFKFIDDVNIKKTEVKSHVPQDEVSPNSCHYNIDDSLITDTTIGEYINAYQLDSGTIHMCAYHINRQGKYPFIQYILQKNNELHEKYPNMATFPSFNFGLNTSAILYQCDCILKIMFTAYCKNINEYGNSIYMYKGFVHQDNNFYLFFDCSQFQLISHKLSERNDLWLVLMDELVNHKSVCHFKIKDNVTQFFLTNKEFMYLTDDENNYIECPIVVYTGCHDRLVNFKLTFGQAVDDNGSIGPYYYYTDYNYAVELATWSKNRTVEIVNQIQLTDETGKYTKGGIVRFALFAGNMILYSNIERNIDDAADVNTDLFNSANNTECIYVNNIVADNAIPFWIVKDHDREIPLTSHVIKHGKMM